VFEELTRVAPTHAGISYASIGPTGRQWPVDSDGVLYSASFDTPDGLAVFGTTQYTVETTDDLVDDEAERRLQLVAGGRASEFDTGHATSDRQLRIHPADARTRGIESVDDIVVSNGEVSVETGVEITDRIRQGTVYLPAQIADPLLRSETSMVVVTPISEDENEFN